MKLLTSYRSRNRIISRFLGLLACTSLAACHSTPEMVDAPEDYAHSYVEYPYNSDGQGNTVPLVVGTFNAAAQHGTYPAEDRIPIGYVRYLGSDEDSRSAVVILSDGNDGNLAHGGLYSVVGKSMDVVVLYRRGFGLSVPSVDCGFLDYPLQLPLLTAELSASARKYTHRCAGRWESIGLPPETLEDSEVAQDLNDLSRVIDKQSFYLVLERSMFAIGIKAARLYPGLIDGMIFIDPNVSPSEYAESYRSRLEELDTGIATLFLTLTEKLSETPVTVETRTRAGTLVTVAIGALDLAFVTSRTFEANSSMEEFSAALSNAAHDDYAALGTMVIEMRKELNSPRNSLLIASLHPRVVDDRQLLPFALTWPESAFRERRIANRIQCGGGVPQLFVTTVSAGGSSDSSTCSRVHVAGSGEALEQALADVIAKFVGRNSADQDDPDSRAD